MVAAIVSFLALAVASGSAQAEDRSGGFCPMNYDLPAEIPITLPSDDGQLAMDRYSWSAFLALAAPGVGERVTRKGDNRTQWEKWSSTVDLIDCNRNSGDCVCPGGDCTVSGSRSYPLECRAIEGFEHYRVIDQLSKVDDSFEESEQGAGGTPRGGLGNSPVIDSHGHFLRYEILTSPVAYDFVVRNGYYQEAVLDALTSPVVFPCGKASYTGGDPADEQVGAYIVKNAWMELPPEEVQKKGGKKAPASYHTEDLLIYTPAYRNSTHVATCELKTMALVGQHLIHKTTRQPRWTWATFEHRLNAPDCTSLPPSGDMQGSGANKSCPESVSQDYNFYPGFCAADGSNPEACQTCNTPVVSNAPGCKNPNLFKDNVSFCLDLPPAPVDGTTKACLQVPLAEYYPDAHRLNENCARRLGKESVWSNYQLISTMWYNEPNDVCRTVQNIQLTFRILQRPQVPIKGGLNDLFPTRPFIANSSMETDVRSDCMGCHSAAAVNGDQVGTDFMYWLQLEVPAHTGRQLPR